MKGGHTESLLSYSAKANRPPPRLMVSSLVLALMTRVTMCWLWTGPGRAKQRTTKNRTLSASHPHPHLKPSPLQPEAAGAPPTSGLLLPWPPALWRVPRASIESHRQWRRPGKRRTGCAVRGERQCASPRAWPISPQSCAREAVGTACVGSTFPPPHKANQSHVRHKQESKREGPPHG